MGVSIWQIAMSAPDTIGLRAAMMWPNPPSRAACSDSSGCEMKSPVATRVNEVVAGGMVGPTVGDGAPVETAGGTAVCVHAASATATASASRASRLAEPPPRGATAATLSTAKTTLCTSDHCAPISPYAVLQHTAHGAGGR